LPGLPGQKFRFLSMLVWNGLGLDDQGAVVTPAEDLHGLTERSAHLLPVRVVQVAGPEAGPVLQPQEPAACDPQTCRSPFPGAQGFRQRLCDSALTVPAVQPIRAQQPEPSGRVLGDGQDRSLSEVHFRRLPQWRAVLHQTVQSGQPKSAVRCGGHVVKLPGRTTLLGYPQTIRGAETPQTRLAHGPQPVPGAVPDAGTALGQLRSQPPACAVEFEGHRRPVAPDGHHHQMPEGIFHQRAGLPHGPPGGDFKPSPCGFRPDTSGRSFRPGQPALGAHPESAVPGDPKVQQPTQAQRLRGLGGFLPDFTLTAHLYHQELIGQQHEQFSGPNRPDRRRGGDRPLVDSHPGPVGSTVEKHAPGGRDPELARLPFPDAGSGAWRQLEHLEGVTVQPGDGVGPLVPCHHVATGGDGHSRACGFGHAVQGLVSSPPTRGRKGHHGHPPQEGCHPESWVGDAAAHVRLPPGTIEPYETAARPAMAAMAWPLCTQTHTPRFLSIP